jgi:hypothetical protein
MRKYNAEDEGAIRSERLVREWTRSSLLDTTQHDRMVQGLKTGLRRTNFFLRMILFGFGILMIAAAVLLAARILGIGDEAPAGILLVSSAAVCFALGERLIDRFNLYRFGIEEAAAAAGATLVALATGLFMSAVPGFEAGNVPTLLGFLVASIAAFAVYCRYGYIYAAIASMVCLAAAVFQLPVPEAAQRLVSAGLLAVSFLAARFRRRESCAEFPGDEYATIQAAAWAGTYALLNLRLLPWTPEVPSLFYSFTYATIWLLPAIGLSLALAEKDRTLLHVNLVLALGTLITNKPYLGLVRQTYDPVILGALLIGAALVLRRWLTAGEPNGFTAKRLSSSDKRRLSMLGTASAAFDGGQPVPADGRSGETLQPGGGRSGGAGASGSF